MRAKRNGTISKLSKFVTIVEGIKISVPLAVLDPLNFFLLPLNCGEATIKSMSRFRSNFGLRFRSFGPGSTEKTSGPKRLKPRCKIWMKLSFL